MLPVGAMPRLPASAAARSLRMSACRLVATMVSSVEGRLTMRAVAASTSSLSHFTSVHAAAHARVFALGVFAHDDPVQVLGRAALQGRIDARQDARGPHVGVLVEAL